MCRLFGFKSVDSTNIRFSLVHAENALRVQSVNNPDGWGIGFYADGELHIVKRPISAEEDTTFLRLSDYVSSDTVIAHVRKGPAGTVNLMNCHPFHYHKWMFAHNGSLEMHAELRPRIFHMLPEYLRQNIFGGTDSELCFHLLLHLLHEEFKVDLEDPNTDIEPVQKAVRETILLLDKLAKEAGATDMSRLNFMLSNGRFIVASRRGAKLYSLQRFLQSDAVGMWARAEQKEGGLLVDLDDNEPAVPQRSVLLASEPITAEAWTSIPQDSVIGVTEKAEIRVRPMDTLSPDDAKTLEAWLDDHLYKKNDG